MSSKDELDKPRIESKGRNKSVDEEVWFNNKSAVQFLEI